MSVLAEQRVELATALEPLNLNTYAYLSGRAALPSAMILAGSPYLESGETFGAHLVRFEVWLTVAKGDNESETAEADTLITAAIGLLTGDGWTVEQVSQPFEFAINNGNAYTTALTVTAEITL
jgi:hypothetical protein